ncbi:hypothetical protein AXG93_4316s1180 [Marchantia polymorpha subsp. ruderalis]|uniref:Uncharacterized protein n=1 Tax=Marchantia polymorpha subsp. ruderalis TaxID=1480154 RepID=A0A176VSB0_MARPO|nr:hypothetical protein AXG93_4316s1180 [Marchantia polymorpha subsp. ruderalis]
MAGRDWPGSHPGVRDAVFLTITACVTVLYQFLFFVVAAGFKFDKVTDFAGTTNFVVLAILTFVLRGAYYFRQVVLTTFVLVWGLRLGLFLLLRILNWGEDKRFDDKRNNLCKFALFWVFQAIWVWTVSLPVTIVNSSGRNPGIQAQDIVGWVMFAVGVIVEAVADQTSTPVLDKGRWAVVAGPILLSCILLFLSGIPLLESSADKRYMSNANYRQYKKVTSILIPLPPAVYGNLPLWFKQVFLFEFPFYSSKVTADEEQLQSSSTQS